ncbi:MAG: SurA N-terminal domain-containing protein [Candidatus Woesearchaeota archaeon]|nr:SurA N-terminal domain-containing protein [Candidatus Woesearchaeota archaeon]
MEEEMDSKDKEKKKEPAKKAGKLPKLDFKPNKKLRPTFISRKKRKVRFARIAAIVLIIAVAFLLINFSKTKAFVSGIFERSPVIVKVNGEPITESEFNTAFNTFFFIRGLPDSYKLMVDRKLVLEQLINEEALLQEASKQGIKIPENNVDSVLNDAISKSALTEDTLKIMLAGRNLSMKELRDYYKRSLTIIELLNRSVEPKVNISEADVIKFYNDSMDKYSAKENEIRLRQILVNSSADADSLLSELKSGADFVSLAHTLSIDSNSSQYGGDLGFVTKETLSKEISSTAFSLKQGEYSGAIKGENGYYILKRENNVIAFVELNGTIKSGLENVMRNTILNEYLSTMRGRAKVEYFLWAAEKKEETGNLTSEDVTEPVIKVQ